MNVVLLGGTGFVGRHLCEKLVRQGHSITVLTRRLSNGSPVQHLPGLTVLQVDVFDEAALAHAVAGHDAVVNLVAILHGKAAAFERAHVSLPRCVVQACKKAGVSRLVHVSAIGASSDAPSLYLRSKAAGEQILQSSGLDVRVLRPSVIFGADDHFINLFARLQRVAPCMPLAGASSRFQPVWVEDVADALVKLITQMGHAPQTLIYEACGTQEYTLAGLVRTAGNCAGCQRPVLPLPAWAGKLQALFMECLPGQPLMSRDNLLSMQVPNVASGQLPGLADLGVTAHSLEAIAPTFLGGAQEAVKNDQRYRAGR